MSALVQFVIWEWINIAFVMNAASYGTGVLMEL